MHSIVLFRPKDDKEDHSHQKEELLLKAIIPFGTILCIYKEDTQHACSIILRSNYCLLHIHDRNLYLHNYSQKYSSFLFTEIFFIFYLHLK